MRFVMSGDKSRYHFFRSIVDLNKSGNQQSFFTERLSKREVFLVSDISKTNDDIFYSHRVPLNTELYFPSESVSVLDVIKNDDKIIWFDEFPYATDRDIEGLREVLDSDKACQAVIVLIQNFREKLETDISTGEMALEEAESRYAQFNMSIYKYTLDSFPYFLLWENNIENAYLEGVFYSKMKNVEQNLDTFDSGYDLWVEEGMYIASLIDFDILAGFCEYDQKLNKSNVWKIYHEKACKYYWQNNNEMISNFCKLLYKGAIAPVCIWDFEKDFEKLYANVIEGFERISDDMECLEYIGAKADYDEFLKENQEEIIAYKTRIQQFFREEMKEIIKARICRNLERLEALFS